MILKKNRSIFLDKKRKEISLFLLRRIKEFWSKKTPVGDKYPYQVHDPYIILGPESGYEKFYLVGDNWLDCPDKPILLALGCNDWKYGFLADYLPDYRVAFGSRKMVTRRAVRAIRGLKIKPTQVAIWGYTETTWLNFYLKKHYKIWRIEDGFVRSSALGASHATPYSLVIDKTGLYYDCYQPSDIEKILNDYDFRSDVKLLEQAQDVLKTIIDLKISKYNPPILYKDQSIKTKKRVAILGQVDNDASIRFGNPDKWSSEDLIKLARYENPEAEIIYRPHPEVFKGYQKSKFQKNRVKYLAKIANPDENIIDFIERVDHVYTITSLSGFEALLRGKKVTVVGAPFYSGWGLTDDRADIERRQRKLSLLELFAGSYLLYPKYLACLNNSHLGVTAAIYRIRADQYVAMSQIEFKLNEDNNSENGAFEILNSYKWPSVLLDVQTLSDKKLATTILRKVRFNEFFEDKTSHIYPSMISYLIVGKLPDHNLRGQFLTIIRNLISYSDFNHLLLDLGRYLPGEYLTQQWAWLFAEVGENDIAIRHVNKSITKLQHESTLDQRHNESFAEVNRDITEEEIVFDYFNSEACSSALELLDIQISDRRLNDAVETARFLLLSNYKTEEIIKRCITVSELMFDFRSVQKISKFLQGINLDYSNKFGILTEFRCNQFNRYLNKEDYIIFLSISLLLRSEKIDSIKFNLYFFPEFISSIDEAFNILKAQLSLDNDLSVKKCQAFVALEEFDKAEKIIKQIVEYGEQNEGALVQFSQVLSYNGKLKEAIALMSFVRSNGLTSLNVRESLRLFVLDARYQDSLKLLNDAIKRSIPIGEMHKRKCYFGNRMLKEAFETFTEIALCKNVATHYKEKYYRFEEPLANTMNIFLLAIFGPGDELRFASIYNMIKNIIDVEHNVSIACSPRLFDLFSRSFPEITFVPVARPRSVDSVDLADYTDVPGSDIMSVVDNSAVAAIGRADKILFVTDMLHLCLPDYEAFPGVRYLEADKIKVSKIKQLLPRENYLVGISWRSSLTTSARNEHYLTIKQLEPLFRFKHIQFVNLQYDDCEEEIAWVNNLYPGKLINLEDIDQYNDFDSTAALMMCMDLIISPATTVVELAGALGCKTWLFSNSSEINWRKIDAAGTDVWHNSVTIVDVENKGDKEALVAELCTRLEEFANQEIQLNDVG